MARAFKCDICGEYLDGMPLKLEFRTNLDGMPLKLEFRTINALSNYIDSIMIDK